jgi:hypothetical protein
MKGLNDVYSFSLFKNLSCPVNINILVPRVRGLSDGPLKTKCQFFQQMAVTVLFKF